MVDHKGEELGPTIYVPIDPWIIKNYTYKHQSRRE